MQIQSSQFQNPLCHWQRKLLLPKIGTNQSQKRKFSFVWLTNYQKHLTDFFFHLSFSPTRLFQEERLAILVVGIHNGWRKTCQNHPRPQLTNGLWVNVKALYPIGLTRSQRPIWKGLHTERIINTGPKLSRPLPTAVMDPRRPQAHRTPVPLQVEVRREPQPRGLREKFGLDHVFTLLWPFFNELLLW